MNFRCLFRRICLGLLLAIGMPKGIAEQSPVHAVIAEPAVAVGELLAAAKGWFKQDVDLEKWISHRARLEKSLNYLRQAIDIAPFRIDLRFTAAGIALYQNDPYRALQLYHQALKIAPEEVDVHIYLAVWLAHVGRLNEAAVHQQWIEAYEPERGSLLKELYQIVQDACTRSYSEDFQKSDGIAPQAIIVLGARLKSTGEMSPSLKARLEKAYQLAKSFPKAKLFLCGGQPLFGLTEARTMKDWLLRKGIEGRRIICEEYSSSTVENALFCRYLLTSHNIRSAALVTSCSHLRRAYAVFKLAVRQSGPRDMKLFPVFAPNAQAQTMLPLTMTERLTICRDALKVIGLPCLRSFPLVDT